MFSSKKNLPNKGNLYNSTYPITIPSCQITIPNHGCLWWKVAIAAKRHPKGPLLGRSTGRVLKSQRPGPWLPIWPTKDGWEALPCWIPPWQRNEIEMSRKEMVGRKLRRIAVLWRTYLLEKNGLNLHLDPAPEPSHFQYLQFFKFWLLGSLKKAAWSGTCKTYLKVLLWQLWRSTPEKARWVVTYRKVLKSPTACSHSTVRFQSSCLSLQQLHGAGRQMTSTDSTDFKAPVVPRHHVVGVQSAHWQTQNSSRCPPAVLLKMVPRTKNLWQWMFRRDLGFISLFYKFFQGPLLTHQVFLKLLPTKTERPGSWSWLTLIATHLSTSPTSHEINRVRLKMSEMNRGQTQNVYFLQDRNNEPFIIGSQ